jgi:hypothetical protein
MVSVYQTGQSRQRLTLPDTANANIGAAKANVRVLLQIDVQAFISF